jgi:hypothetical protein
MPEHVSPGVWRLRCGFCPWFMDYPIAVEASTVDDDFARHLDVHVAEILKEAASR